MYSVTMYVGMRAVRAGQPRCSSETRAQRGGGGKGGGKGVTGNGHGAGGRLRKVINTWYTLNKKNKKKSFSAFFVF